MPELPDLHVFSKNLRKLLLNKTITSVTVDNPPRLNVTSAAFVEALTGASITDILRDGKEMGFFLSNKNRFNVHLMLNGKFFVCGKDEPEKMSSKIISVCFEDNSALVVTDYQNYCKVTLNPKISSVPDAMSEGFTREYFFNIIKKNGRKNIKTLLIDQNIVKGIGNAYVDEILWTAKISPESTAGSIPEDYLQQLYDAVSFVLNDAIANIERISPDIINGEERSFLRVHNSKKKVTDEGEPIIVRKISSKYTYYTKSQKLFL